MRILFADGLSGAAIERLRAGGDVCVVEPSLTAAELPGHVEGIDVLVVRSTRVTARTIEAGRELGLVVRAGSGTNTVDCRRAAELGVFVCNVPGRNAVAVAELTMGLMLATDRHIASGTADLRSGIWNKRAYSKARGLYGTTLGIVGMGAIGLEVAQRAAACGMRVVATGKPRPPSVLRRMDEIGVTTLPSLDDVLAAGDVVSVHVPGGPHTAGLVDSRFLAAMKHDAVLINTSRGEVVDEAALLAALDSTNLRAGLDVLADEPPAATGALDCALARHAKVTVTHHIGASTQQAQQAVAEGAVEVIEQYRSGSVINCVNLESAPHKTATLSVRHYDRVGALASVLQELRRRDINVANMSNRIFAGSQAAAATIEVSGAVDEGLLDGIRSLPDIIGVTVFKP